MYRFKIENDAKAFDQFVWDNKGSYLQCSRWHLVKEAWDSILYSGFEGENRVLTCMVLTRKMPGAGIIWYIPCGAVCDYSNKDLQKEFLDFIKKESKKAGATALVIDPLIPLRINDEIIADGGENHKLFIEN